MSYTAPQYVDTKEQAILALASTIKGEAVTGGDGSVNRALDILADVLAEQDVQVPQTDAGAILALAQYVGGGGGGGGDLTTASLTVVNNSEGGAVTIECAIAGFEFEPQGSSTSVYAEAGESTTADAILYKGIALAHCANRGYSIAIVGDAEMDAMGLIIISGDCTLTVTDE